MNTPSSRVWLRVVLAAILIFSLTLPMGCGRGKHKTTSLTGKVTYKDQPVSGGSLTLHPVDAKDKPMSIPLGSDGTFQFDAPPLGEMKVTVETESVRGQTGVAYKIPPGMKAPDGKDIKAPEVDSSKLIKYVKIPNKYANVNSTPLKCTIKEGPNKVDFPLSD